MALLNDLIDMEFPEFVEKIQRKQDLHEELVNENVEPKLNDNFWKWFGNSKTIKNGKPMVFYHGTDNDFDTFDKCKISKGNYWGEMFYFGKNDKWLKQKKYTITMPVFLKMENPFILKNKNGALELENILGKSGLTKKEIGVNDYWAKWVLGYRAENPEEFSKKMQNAGYDGLIVPRYGIYGVFEPNQIKSVDNCGRWDSSSQNIYEDVRPQYLYHAMWKDQFIKCRKDGKLYSHSAYERNGNNSQHRILNGISMSRDLNVCVKFMESKIEEYTDEWKTDKNAIFSMNSVDDDKSHLITKDSDLSFVVLVFDYNLLKKNHKIVPHSYLGGSMRDTYGDEQEEVVIGDIPNFMDYVVNVIEYNNNVNRKTLKSKDLVESKVLSNTSDNIYESKKDNKYIVYHWSPNVFNKFDKKYIGSTNGNTYLDGFYFGDKIIENWGYLYKCEIILNNPIEIDMNKTYMDSIGVQEAISAFIYHNEWGYLKDYLENELKLDKNEVMYTLEKWKKADGVILYNIQYDLHKIEYIVFNSNQIKIIDIKNLENSSKDNVYESEQPSNKIIAYHGSQTDNLQFYQNQAFYLTDDYELAKTFAMKEDYGGLYNGETGTVYTCELDIKNPYNCYSLTEYENYFEDSELDKDYWLNKGYDSIIIHKSEDIDSTYYIMLKPEESVKIVNKIILDEYGDEIDNQVNETLKLSGVKINESIGQQYLYHGCKLDVLFQILKDDILYASQSISNCSYGPYGVSTSRNLNFAYDFASYSSTHLEGEPFNKFLKIGACVIVLDANKIRQNYKIVPYRDLEAFKDKNDEPILDPSLLEHEEIILSDIKNIKNYIVDIYVSPDCKELNTPEKIYEYYNYYIDNMGLENPTKEDISENMDVINTIMNAKVYVPNRSEYNLRNNINETVEYDKIRDDLFKYVMQTGEIINENIIQDNDFSDYITYYAPEELVKKLIDESGLEESDELVDYVRNNYDTGVSLELVKFIFNDLYEKNKRILEQQLSIGNKIYRLITSNDDIDYVIEQCKIHGTGNCWAKTESRAESYFGGKDKYDFVFEAEFKEEDVDWFETMYLRMSADEDEIRLKKTSKIDVLSVMIYRYKETENGYSNIVEAEKRKPLNMVLPIGDKYSY